MLGGCFIDFFRVFHKLPKGASMSLEECSQKDSNVFVLCFKGVLGCFLSKEGLFLCTEVKACTDAKSIGQKHPKNTLDTPIIYSRITLKYTCNNLEVPLKTHELA